MRAVALPAIAGAAVGSTATKIAMATVRVWISKWLLPSTVGLVLLAGWTRTGRTVTDFETGRPSLTASPRERNAAYIRGLPAVGGAPTSRSQPPPTPAVHAVSHGVKALSAVPLVVDPTSGASTDAGTPTSQSAGERQSELDENDVMADAHSAFLRGDLTGALIPIYAHEANFPNSRRSRERDSLRVRLLIAVGRRDEAAFHGGRFLQAYPQGSDSDAVRALLPAMSR